MEQREKIKKVNAINTIQINAVHSIQMGQEIMVVRMATNVVNGMLHIYAIAQRIVKHAIGLNVRLNTTKTVL